MKTRKKTKTKIMTIVLAMAMLIGISYIVYKNMDTPYAAPADYSHKWVKQTDKGHYEYQTITGIFCACNAGPYSDNGIAKHVRDITKQYGGAETIKNHAGTRRDGTKITVLQWVVDISYKCSVCGITKAGEKEDAYGNAVESATPDSENGNYKITSTAKKEVQYTKATSSTKTNIKIPDIVKINGVSFKVTSIAPNAFKNHDEIKKLTIGKYVSKIGKKCFYGCKNLKSITIKTTKLTSKTVGANAFKGIHKKAKVKVPKSKKKAYKKLLKKKGITGKKQVVQ